MGLRMGSQEERYQEAIAAFGLAIARLARAYEVNADQRADLIQDIHVAIWRSLNLYDGRCTLRTWVYRVAHNVASSHALRQARRRPERSMSLDDLEGLPDASDPETYAGERQAWERLLSLIHRLGPSDRQVMLLYLEDLDASAIGEITGHTAGAIAVKIHRLKSLLARRFNKGGTDAEPAS